MIKQPTVRKKQLINMTKQPIDTSKKGPEINDQKKANSKELAPS